MQKLLLAFLFTSSVLLNAMEKEGTTYTSVYAAKPDPKLVNYSGQQEEKSIAAEYEGINTTDPKNQTQKNSLLEKYIINTTPAHLNKTIPGELDGPLHIAARSDLDNESLELGLMKLKNQKFPLNGCDTTGNTPLMIACDYRAVKNTTTLAHFLELSKNLDDADRTSRTALHHICSPTLDSLDREEISRRFACAEILLTKGANPDVLDVNDLTPLCYVATSFFGSLGDCPADTTLRKCDYESFMRQRKALISLLIRHKSQTKYTLERIEKLKQTVSDDYLKEFEHHIKLPTQNHDCNLH